jgi:hypothetical protein
MCDLKTLTFHYAVTATEQSTGPNVAASNLAPADETESPAAISIEASAAGATQESPSDRASHPVALLNDRFQQAGV